LLGHFFGLASEQKQLREGCRANAALLNSVLQGFDFLVLGVVSGFKTSDCSIWWITSAHNQAAAQIQVSNYFDATMSSKCILSKANSGAAMEPTYQAARARRKASIGLLQPPRLGVLTVRCGGHGLLTMLYRNSCNLGNASIHRDRSSRKVLLASFSMLRSIPATFGSRQLVDRHNQIFHRLRNNDSDRSG
jgi:hypothetical protein